MYINNKFIPKNYVKCSKSILDNISDPDIEFDENGISNYYYQFNEFVDNLPNEKIRKEKFDSYIDKIKQSGKGKKYDCILGLSGGLDSSYLALLAKDYGLNPLVVHFDYGWNTDIAIRNIELITKKLDFDLYTYVIDWEMIKDLQRSYYMASVIDLDVPADHTIFGAIFKIAKKMKIKYILSGSNFQTELIMPKSWNYLKTDLTNIRNIHNKFGKRKFENIPTNGILQQLFYKIYGFESVPLLYYTDYIKEDVVSRLKNEIGWQDYGGKHFENIYTRFYQGYVLPYKFGVDKRKAHLSNLIFSNQISLENAEFEFNNNNYTTAMMKSDFEFIAKKLDFTVEQFEEILNQKNIPHEFYGTDIKQRKLLFNILNFITFGLRTQLLKSKILRK
jgi:N-acetyl sugar amidotransferase